jgi:hypothetical protein
MNCHFRSLNGEVCFISACFANKDIFSFPLKMGPLTWPLIAVEMKAFKIIKENNLTDWVVLLHIIKIFHFIFHPQPPKGGSLAMELSPPSGGIGG